FQLSTQHSLFFFFQAEDGIRDFHVTGVQTCALPICTAAGETRAACRVAPVAAGGGRRPGGADPVSGGGTVSYDGHLAVSVRDRVATVELQRPEVLNALHSDTHRALQRVMGELEYDDGVGAVVLRG